MLRRNLYLCNKFNLAIPGGPLDLCLGLWGMKLGLDNLLKKENGERTQTRWTVQCNSSILPRTAVLNMASHWKQLVLNELCSAWAVLTESLSHAKTTAVLGCGVPARFFFLPWRIFQGLQPFLENMGQSTSKWLVLLHIDLLPSCGCQGASLKQKQRSGTERNNKEK